MVEECLVSKYCGVNLNHKNVSMWDEAETEGMKSNIIYSSSSSSTKHLLAVKAGPP